MVEIIHKPVKQLVVMDYTVYPKPEDLASILSVAVGAGQPAFLSWTEGVVFLPVPLPAQTDQLTEEYLKGRIYWATVAFSLMPAFQPVLRVRGLEVPVIDVTPSDTMRQVAIWLKERVEAARKKQV